MGVSGCGKTSVGKALAEELHCPFYEGDEFHPGENINKMTQGTALSDSDRLPWLHAIHDHMLNLEGRGERGVYSCSALTESYRQILRGALDNVQFVFLKGTFETLRDRLSNRRAHFMSPTLLQSQLDTLQIPHASFSVSIELSISSIVNETLKFLNN